MSRSFTTVSNAGLLRVLQTGCGISLPHKPAGEYAEKTTFPPIVTFDAIWDTGATGSVITQQVIDAVGLAPVSMTQVHGVNSSGMTEVYLVNIYLPNNVAFPGVPVIKGQLPNTQADILIGMDIINQGDFAVTNRNGATKFSFRVPSQADIDFVNEHNHQTMNRKARRANAKKNRGKRKR